MCLHNPDESDTEALTDAVPPEKGRKRYLTTYSDSCWVSQIGNAIWHGVMLPLFRSIF